MTGAPSPSTAVVQQPKIHSACDECRSRKMKCSGQQPACLRCAEDGISCNYSPVAKMGRPRKRKRDGDSVEKQPRTSSPTRQRRGTHATATSDAQFQAVNGPDSEHPSLSNGQVKHENIQWEHEYPHPNTWHDIPSPVPFVYQSYPAGSPSAQMQPYSNTHSPRSGAEYSSHPNSQVPPHMMQSNPTVPGDSPRTGLSHQPPPPVAHQLNLRQSSAAVHNILHGGPQLPAPPVHNNVLPFPTPFFGSHNRQSFSVPSASSLQSPPVSDHMSQASISRRSTQEPPRDPYEVMATMANQVYDCDCQMNFFVAISDLQYIISGAKKRATSAATTATPVAPGPPRPVGAFPFLHETIPLAMKARKNCQKALTCPGCKYNFPTVMMLGTILPLMLHCLTQSLISTKNNLNSSPPETPSAANFTNGNLPDSSSSSDPHAVTLPPITHVQIGSLEDIHPDQLKNNVLPEVPFPNLRDIVLAEIKHIQKIVHGMKRRSQVRHGYDEATPEEAADPKFMGGENGGIAKGVLCSGGKFVQLNNKTMVGLGQREQGVDLPLCLRIVENCEALIVAAEEKAGVFPGMSDGVEVALAAQLGAPRS